MGIRYLCVLRIKGGPAIFHTSKCRLARVVKLNNRRPSARVKATFVLPSLGAGGEVGVWRTPKSRNHHLMKAYHINPSRGSLEPNAVSVSLGLFHRNGFKRGAGNFLFPVNKQLPDLSVGSPRPNP